MPEPESPFLIDQIRTTLHQHEPDYFPGDSVYDAVNQIYFTGVEGGVGVGKSTNVDKAIELFPELKHINTTTTRSDKPNDPPGFRTAKDGITFSYYRDAVNEGRVVNYSVIPDADIYGTFPEDFNGTYNIGPFLPASNAHIERAGFKGHRFLYVVSEGMFWDENLQKILPLLGTERSRARIFEALDSIQYAKKNTNKLTFVENKKDRVDETATTIAQLALFRTNEGLTLERAFQLLDEMRNIAKTWANKLN